MTSPQGTSRPHRAVEFRALPSRAAQALRISSAQLRYWGLPHLADPAAHGIGELLTHLSRQPAADQHCTVRLVWDLDRLTVSVHEHDSRPPPIRPAVPAVVAGRGPAMITAVSDVSDDGETRAPRDGRKQTGWFTLPTPDRPSPPRADAAAAYRPVVPA